MHVKPFKTSQEKNIVHPQLASIVQCGTNVILVAMSEEMTHDIYKYTNLCIKALMEAQCFVGSFYN